MRVLLGGLALLAVGLTSAPAAAQEYPWCAYYDQEGTVTNCGFVTIEQCRATVSGVGGYCGENPFYATAVRKVPRPPAKPRRSDR
jgi:hypothetical protein